MARSKRESTKQKTHKSATAAKARISSSSSKGKTKNKPTSIRGSMEEYIRQRLKLNEVAITDPGILQANEQSWLRPFATDDDNNSNDPPHPLAFAPHRLANLPHQNRNKQGRGLNLYVWVQTDTYLSNSTTVVPFPVLVVAQSKFPPTTRLAITSVQSGTQEFRSFDATGFAWKSILPQGLSFPYDVYVLQAPALSTSTNRFLLERGFVVPVQKPRDVEGQEPNPVTTVTVEYGGQNYLWDTVNQSLREFFEEDAEDLSDDDKATLRALLKQERDRLVAEEEAKLQHEREGFRAMVEQIATVHSTTVEEVTHSLDRDLALYKLYPTGLPQPQPSVFGSTGGVDMTFKVNRFADAQAYYTE